MLQALKSIGSGGIRTHASEETGALNQRLRPLGHATLMICQSFSTILMCWCFPCPIYFLKNILPPVRLELTAFRLWDWRAAYCATEALLLLQYSHLHSQNGSENKKRKKSLRWPGIEPGSTAWKAAMLTTIPPTLVDRIAFQVVPDKTIIEL